MKNIAFCLIIGVLAKSAHSDELRSDNSVTPNYNCAVASAFITLRWAGKDVSLRDVAGLFPNEYRSAGNMVPLSVLCDVLVSKGVQARAVKFNLAELQEDEAPCILVLDPSGKLQSTTNGHYVFVKEILPSGDVKFIDSDMPDIELIRKREVISRLSAGYGISLASYPSFVQVFSTFVLGGLALLELWKFILPSFSIRVASEANG